MNLLALTANVISAVNPPILCSVQLSTGNTQGTDFSQVPSYQTYNKIPCQVQPLSSQDLRHLDGLNLQATMRAIYVLGNSEGIDRAAIKGGDLFVMPSIQSFPGPTIWLVTQVIEHWDGAGGWTKVAATLQNGS